MDVNLIYWKLNEIMARKRVRNKDLAIALGVTENSVYRLRRTDEMPRLTSERLNGICSFLQCQPGELLTWITDEPVTDNQPAIYTEKNENKVVEKLQSERSDFQKSDKNLKAFIGLRLLKSA